MFFFPLSALTLEDEKRQIGILICAFIRKISFGRDFEQQLGFYVEARATFSNLDLALVQLVQVTKFELFLVEIFNKNQIYLFKLTDF